MLGSVILKSRRPKKGVGYEPLGKPEFVGSQVHPPFAAQRWLLRAAPRLSRAPRLESYLGLYEDSIGPLRV